MNIVILDGYAENPGDLTWEGFEQLGNVTYYDRSKPEEVLDRMKHADVVITNKVVIDKPLMDACPRLTYIGVLAAGYDVVDAEEAKKHHIALTNVPGYGTLAVAQYAIALLLEVCNQVGHHNAEVKKNRWIENADWCFWDFPLIELAGKTMGIIGFGRIGQATAKIADAMGMHVQFYDTHSPERTIPPYKKNTFQTLLQTSDVVVLHCPLTKDNYKIMNKDAFQQMKKTAILINNARGKLIDEHALANALQSGQLYAAALDVSFEEPIHADNPLIDCANCLITPHISWAAKEARKRIMDIAVKNLKMFLQHKEENRIV